MESFKPLLRRLIVSVILLFAVWFCWANRETMLLALQLTTLDLALILLSYVGFFLLTAAMACLMLRHRGTTVPLLQMLLVNCWCSLLGQVTFLRAGYYSGKAYYYRQLYQVPITISLGMMVFLSLVMIFINSAVGLLAGLWATAAEGLAIPPLYWIILGLSVLLCIVVILGIHTLKFLKNLPARVQMWCVNLHSVFDSTSPREIISLVCLGALTIPLQVVVFGLLFNRFGQSIPVLYLVFIAIFSSLSLIVSLTPGNIGVRELVILLVVAHLDISSVSVLSILVVDRVLQFLTVLALGLGGYQKLKRFKVPGQIPV